MNTLLNVTEETLAAEANVLGAILVNHHKMDEVAGDLSEEDFTEPHNLIWRGMKYLYQQNEEINTATLDIILRQANRIHEVGGSKYLSKLYNSVPSAEGIKFYAKVVKSNATRRKALKVIDEARGLITTQIEDDEELLSRIEQKIMEIRPDNLTSMKHISDSEESYFQHLSKSDELILTGFKQFDNWCGGISRDCLYILAGRPSAGKTAKALQMAQNIANTNAGHVLIWSQEMNTNTLLNRMMANLANIPAAAIRNRKLDKAQLQRMRETYKHLNSLPLHIEDSKGVTIDKVISTARQFNRKHGRLGAIIVDYLTLMKIVQLPNQRWDQAVGQVAWKAKQLSGELNCPFILLAQLNREGADKKPTLGNLKDSGEIEQHADVVEFLWKNPDDSDPSDGKAVESVIAKGRDLGTKDFKFLFKPWFQRFEDVN